MDSTAVISDDGKFRYLLERRWRNEGSSMLFIMLNPSTADAFVDDPTIRRCVGFAKRENCGRLKVVNLFSLRATHPKDLVGQTNGPEWLGYFTQAVNDSRFICAAWGSHKSVKESPAYEIIENIETLWCLGTTKEGHPRHPLYVKSDTPLTRYYV